MLAWLNEIMYYYDKTYDYGMMQRRKETVFPVDPGHDADLTAQRILEIASAIKIPAYSEPANET